MVWTHPSDTCGAPTIFIISPLADKVIRAADSLIALNLYSYLAPGVAYGLRTSQEPIRESPRSSIRPVDFFTMQLRCNVVED